MHVAFERITVDPAQMGGLPCIRGMRITVSMVLGQLAASQTIEQILTDYPTSSSDTGAEPAALSTLGRFPSGRYN